MNEQKLRQLFKNRANCYADAEDVIQAMDEDCFIETVNEALRLFAVSGQLPDFLYEDGGNVKIGYHGDTVVIDEWANWKAGNLR